MQTQPRRIYTSNYQLDLICFAVIQCDLIYCGSTLFDWMPFASIRLDSIYLLCHSTLLLCTLVTSNPGKGSQGCNTSNNASSKRGLLTQGLLIAYKAHGRANPRLCLSESATKPPQSMTHKLSKPCLALDGSEPLGSGLLHPSFSTHQAWRMVRRLKIGEVHPTPDGRRFLWMS